MRASRGSIRRSTRWWRRSRLPHRPAGIAVSGATRVGGDPDTRLTARATSSMRRSRSKSGFATTQPTRGETRVERARNSVRNRGRSIARESSTSIWPNARSRSAPSGSPEAAIELPVELRRVEARRGSFADEAGVEQRVDVRVRVDVVRRPEHDRDVPCLAGSPQRAEVARVRDVEGNRPQLDVEADLGELALRHLRERERRREVRHVEDRLSVARVATARGSSPVATSELVSAIDARVAEPREERGQELIGRRAGARGRRPLSARARCGSIARFTARRRLGLSLNSGREVLSTSTRSVSPGRRKNCDLLHAVLGRSDSAPGSR